MEPQPSLPLESLRRLAHGLLYDRDRAEDVVQEAWLAALRKKPELGVVPAWMRTAVRHVALNARRADERRTRHEQLAARPSETSGTSEVLAQVEILRRVLDALAELDEPYRTAVGLRYLEDQPPRAIARTLGLPVNTVRTHVRRGLAELRQRLERRTRREDLLSVLAPLAGAPPRSLALGPAGLVGAALALSAAGLLWLALRTPRATPAPVTGATGAAPIAQGPTLTPDSARARREPAGDTNALEAAWSVHGRVSRGRAGRAAHAPVRARLRAGYRSDDPVAAEELLSTDARGEFTWTLPAPTTGVRLEAECLLDGHTCTPVAAVVPRGELPSELFLRAWPHDATLLGTLRAPDGRPVADGRLVLGKVRTTSASDGRFTLPVASENEALELLAWSTGVGALRTALAPFRPGEARALEVQLQPEMLVRGTIRDELGAALEGVQVRSLFHQLLDEENGLATSGADGRYELRLDPAQRYVDLLVSLPGRVPAELGTNLRDPAGDSFELANQDPEHVDFVLPPGETVQGRVTDQDGAALEGASVVMGLHGKTHLAVTDSEGRFTLEHVGPHASELSAYRPGYAQASPALTAEGLLFELEQLTPVTGHVRDERGAPLADVEIFARGPTWSDEDGAFRALVATRTQSLTFRAPGKGKRQLELGATRDGLEIVLPDLGTFRGRVLDADTGAPVTDVTLLFFDPDDPGDRPDELPSEWRDGVHHTSADGRWQLAAEFAPGLSMALLVQADGYAPAFVQELLSQPEDANEECVVRLYRSTVIRGHISFAEGEDLALVSVQRCTASGGWLPETLDRVLLDRAGNFELLDTPSGDGYLRVNLRATFVLDGPFPVTGAPQERSIGVTPQARIEGLLLDPTGRSLAHRMAVLVSRNPRGESIRTGIGTDDDGRFTLNGLAPGEHELGLQLWATTASPPSEVDLPDDQRTSTPRQPRIAELDLVERVTLSAGQPLEVVLQARGTTRLHGWLTLAGGLPDIVAVTLTELDAENRPSGRRRAALADHGEFEVRALEAGTYLVSAEAVRADGTACRGETRLVVEPDETEASVQLELAGP